MQPRTQGLGRPRSGGRTRCTILRKVLGGGRAPRRTGNAPCWHEGVATRRLDAPAVPRSTTGGVGITRVGARTDVHPGRVARSRPSGVTALRHGTNANPFHSEFRVVLPGGERLAWRAVRRAGLITACCALYLTFVVAASGCQGPVGVKVLSSSSSGSSGHALPSTTGGDATGDVTTGDVDDGPGRSPPPSFPLPAGCDDGVAVPGQYDCFLPVPLDWVDEELEGNVELSPLDLDGDGRDELIARHPGQQAAVLEWIDDELRLTSSIESSAGRYGYSAVHTRWDWNGDGRRDITILPRDHVATVAVHHSLGAGGLGSQILVHQLPPKDWAHGSYGVTGHAIPIDVDGDGMPELLLSLQVGNIESANPAEELALYRYSHMSSNWEPVGERYPWGPCGWLQSVAYGDFDADGDEDLAVLDQGQACDPFPSDYDPDWYQVGIFLSDPQEGTLTLHGWYPTGGTISEAKIWAGDVSGDGGIDLVVKISKPLYGAALLRGRGDGSFEPGAPISLDPVLSAYDLETLMDADGDGVQEWIRPIGEGRPWAIPFSFAPSGIAPMIALNDPAAGGTTRFKVPAGDVNGDGVGDYVARTNLDDAAANYEGDFLMVSRP